jgi:hypothetical protein
MSAAKSRLLAYVKHTPGFETSFREYISLPVGEILERFENEDPEAYRKCLERFERNGTPLPAPA